MPPVNILLRLSSTTKQTSSTSVGVFLLTMEATKARRSESEGEDDRMLEIELQAAEALAALGHLAAACESVTERVKAESDGGNSCFESVESLSKRSINVDKDSQKTCIWTAKPVADGQITELGSNASKYAFSGGRKFRRTLTEAEKEARKIRRMLANRESARQTIRRRQAMYEELTRKAGDLALENKNLKRKKEKASKELESLKTTNEFLKSKMIKIMKVKAEEIHSSSRNSSFMMPNPFTWPSLIVLPHPWHFDFPFLQNGNELRPRSFNLNEKPVDSFSPWNLHSINTHVMHESRHVPRVCFDKTVCDMAAAAEARKRRKQLKMQKDLRCRQQRTR